METGCHVTIDIKMLWSTKQGQRVLARRHRLSQTLGLGHVLTYYEVFRSSPPLCFLVQTLPSDEVFSGT